MPVWNGAAHLREAIESILAQTLRDFEFIILDDGSTDETPELLKEYQQRDQRIRVITLNHEGIVIALNRGVEEARAEWIARMDCDDVAHPERLMLQYDAVKRDTRIVLCHSRVEYITHDNRSPKPGKAIRSIDHLKLRLCYHTPIIHPTVVFRKDAFIKSSGYLAAERHAEDYGLWGRIIEHGKIHGIQKPLLKYRLHPNSISQNVLDYQCSLGKEIAINNCKKFLSTSDKDIEKAYHFMSGESEQSLSSAIWFVKNCYPSFEIFNWENLSWMILKFIKITYLRLKLYLCL